MNALLSPLLLIPALPLASQQEEPRPLFDEGPLVIEGHIMNANGAKVLFQNMEIVGETEHVTYVDEEGHFELRVDVLSPHESQLSVGGQVLRLFAAPRDTIAVSADLEDFEGTLAFKGAKAGTHRSMNALAKALLERQAQEDFGTKKEELGPGEFKAFASAFFASLDAEVKSIEENHAPERHGRAWMRTFLKYKHGEELLEYGWHHADILPEDYHDFGAALLRRGPHDLECPQYYDDFMPKFHLMHRLAQLEDYPRIMAQFREQTEAGMGTVFEYLDAKIEDEQVKRLLVTQLMTRFVEFDHAGADGLFELYSRIVPDDTSQSFIRRRISARFELEPLVASLGDLQDSALLGELFKEIGAAHRDKVIYMDIWATWCGACISTFPDSKRLAEELSGSAVQPIYLCINSPRETWDADSRKYGLPADASYYLTKEQSRELSRLFRYNAIPRYVIFDREGNIVDDNAKQPTSRALKGELLELAGD